MVAEEEENFEILVYFWTMISLSMKPELLLDKSHLSGFLRKGILRRMSTKLVFHNRTLEEDLSFPRSCQCPVLWVNLFDFQPGHYYLHLSTNNVLQKWTLFSYENCFKIIFSSKLSYKCLGDINWSFETWNFRLLMKGTLCVWFLP